MLTSNTEGLNLRVQLAGLLFDCPYEDPSEDCVLQEIRIMSLSDRLHWLKELSSEKVAQIMKTHQECLARRES